jgi:hypothetical protein
MNAIVESSGDHVGCESSAASVVTWNGKAPAAFHRPDVAVARPVAREHDLGAIRGALGSVSDAASVVSCVAAPPLGLIE